MQSRLGALALIAVLGLVFFANLAAHPTQTLYSDYSDLLTLHLPSKHFLVRSWQETGELPLWCPYQFAGLPCLHDIQVAAFYPFHLPLYFLPPASLGAALSWLIVLHVIAAGWCMYWYAQSQGLRGPGALVAAIGYMLAGKWLLHLLAGGHYNMVPLAWLPLVLLGLEQAIRRRNFLYATWAGVAFALIILGAYPYVTLYSGLFVALWTFSTVLEEAGWWSPKHFLNRRRLVAAVGWWAGLGAWTAIVAVLLGAVQLLPGLEFSREASRSAGVAISPQILVDGIRSLVGIVGPPLTDEPNSWENRAGMGILWLTLAVCAPLLNRGRIRYQAGVLLALVVFVLGGAVTVQWLPGFRLFRLPSRMYLVAALPVALLAAYSVQALLATPGLSMTVRNQVRRILLKITGIVVVLAVVFGLALTLQRQDVHPRWHPYWLTLFVTIPCAAWLLGSRPGKLHGPIWVTLLLVDMVSLTWNLVATRPESEVLAPSACIRYLAEHQTDHGRVLDFNPLSYETAANHTPLWPGLPVIVGIEAIRGFNPLDILRYKEYLQFITDEDAPLQPLDQMFTGPILGTFPIKNQTLADLLGIQYLVQPTEIPLESTVQAQSPTDCWKRVFEDRHPTTFNFIAVRPAGRDCGLQSLPPYCLYENKKVLPRTFVVHEAALLADKDHVLSQLKATDFQRRVLLENIPAEELVNGIGSQKGAWVPGKHSLDGLEVRPTEAAAILEYSPNRIVVESKAIGTGYLVLTDIWFPGWTCTVDGQPVPVERADYLFRAVAVPRGTHQVVFTFSPASYFWGKLLSIATAVMVVSITLLILTTTWISRHILFEREAKPDAVLC